MQKIILALFALTCLTAAATACPPIGSSFAFSNQVLLPQVQVQSFAVQQPVIVPQVAVATPFFGFSSVGFFGSSSGFIRSFGFNQGFFVGGAGFRGRAVAPFAGRGNFRQNTTFRQNTRVR